jgi:hypothetical protein
MTEQLRQWQNAGAGPRQVKELAKAISDLRAEGVTYDEVTGVAGGEERTFTYLSLMSTPRPEVTELDEAIREKHGYTVTRDTVRQVIADYEAALPEARKSWPVKDSRRTPEEDAEINAMAAERQAREQAELDSENTILAQVMAKAPAGAKALIVAEYHEDDSDLQADYRSSRTVRTVAIGFRSSSREDFRALRAAAGQFPETAHMASEETLRAWQEARGTRPGTWSLEHRENYSMGAGNYLSDHGQADSGTGWIVKSAAFPCKWVHLTEDAIPAAQPASAPPAAGGEVTVRPSSLGHPGVVEVVFPGKPPADVRQALKDHKFRWDGTHQCWYGRDAAYAETLRTS